MYETLAILAGFVFVYSVVSGDLERTPINGALVFSAFGLIMGTQGLNVIELNVEAEGLRTLAELTLALVLFTDAANANLRVLRGSISTPTRLLLVGLPLTIALGFGAGVLLFDNLGLLEIAILATMLAPTDAALGKAVVTNTAVPASIREGLNVESGLNDGICVPILFVFLALASESHGGDSTTALAFGLVAEEIGIGATVGIVLTAVAAWVIKGCARHDWITKSWQQLPVAALAVACFALAQALGGSGFIAAFSGGMLFDLLAGKHKEKFLLAAEGTGDTLALLTWVVFGASLTGELINRLTWDVLLYAVLSLTLIRMLPVFLVLTGLGLRTDEKLFMGWFGPRGLASIVFGVIVLNDRLPGGDFIIACVVCTIVLSVVAHGLSANPLVGALANRIKRSGK
jgi:NhaP-type Na+/H+ or K+/H+ antiporter